MKICLVQNKPYPGQTSKNFAEHKRIIESVSQESVDLIVFSELSLTGYEPNLAQDLAFDPDSRDLDVFQELSDAQETCIAVGLPLRGSEGLHIGMALFQPSSPRTLGAKNYLHSDEDPFFVSGPNLPILTLKGHRIAFAICYELSIPEHAEAAAKASADIYIASVAKTASGVKSAHKRLSEIAQTYSITTLMVNAIGPADNFVCAGQSAVWNSEGQLIQALGDNEEGILRNPPD